MLFRSNKLSLQGSLSPLSRPRHLGSLSPLHSLGGSAHTAFVGRAHTAFVGQLTQPWWVSSVIWTRVHSVCHTCFQVCGLNRPGWGDPGGQTAGTTRSFPSCLLVSPPHRAWLRSPEGTLSLPTPSTGCHAARPGLAQVWGAPSSAFRFGSVERTCRGGLSSCGTLGLEAPA